MAEWPEQTDNTLSNPEIGLKSDWWMLLGRASQRVPDNGVDPVATLVPGVGQSSTQLNSTQLSGNTTSGGEIAELASLVTAVRGRGRESWQGQRNSWNASFYSCLRLREKLVLM